MDIGIAILVGFIVLGVILGAIIIVHAFLTSRRE